MKKLLLYGLLALSTTFYGCGNDDDPTPSPAPVNPTNPGPCRLTGTTTNGNPATEFIYSGHKIIRQNLFGSNGQPADYNDIIYSGGRIDSIKQYMSLFGRVYYIIKANYSQTTGRLSGMDILNYDLMSGTYILNVRFIYALNPEGQIVLQYGYNAAGEPVSEHMFEYANGNQTKVAQYNYVNGVRTYYDTKTMVYDNNISPYYSWLMPYSHYSYNSTHNATQVQALLANGSINPQYSYSSTFEYNSNNYPTKEVRTYTNGTVHTFTFQYACP